MPFKVTPTTRKRASNGQFHFIQHETSRTVTGLDLSMTLNVTHDTNDTGAEGRIHRLPSGMSRDFSGFIGLRIYIKQRIGVSPKLPIPKRRNPYFVFSYFLFTLQNKDLLISCVGVFYTPFLLFLLIKIKIYVISKVKGSLNTDSNKNH